MHRKSGIVLLGIAVALSAWLTASCGRPQEVVTPTPEAPAASATPTALPTPAVEPPTPVPTSAPTPVPALSPEPSPTPEPTVTAVPALDGQKLLQERCTRCHSLDRVRQARKSEADWKATVERMVSKGAVLSAEELEAVVRHLAAAYPK